ncbi:MAG: DUF512 domain-containing protein [Desulfosporosinus sp.]
MPKGLLVAAVDSGGIAEQMEVQAGDRVLAVNEQEINDIIDFQFGISEEDYTLLIEKPNGELWEISVEKEPGDFLGLEVETISTDGLKKCHNNCLFCYIAQMPKGMRAMLYDKDDDYRLSLTQGSFITLSNLSEEEIKRIIRMHLSPLYISVHAWNPEVRTRLMNNPRAGKLPEQIKRFVKAGIVIHAQVVLVPGYNDGDVLRETIERLAEFYPSVQSIAVVPVGLTRYREQLTPLRAFSSAEANCLLDQAETWQKHFFDQIGRHFVYFADEFYVLAKRAFPDAVIYDDFPQLENGVGMARKFIMELEAGWRQLPKALPERHVHLITGTSAQELFELYRDRLMEQVSGLKLTLHAIRNDFFGSSITVAGLVTAQDIANQLGNLSGEEFLIPRVMLKADEDIFLDQLSVKWLEEKVNGKAIIVENNGFSFLEHVIGYPMGVECFE